MREEHVPQLTELTKDYSAAAIEHAELAAVNPRCTMTSTPNHEALGVVLKK